jgi:hypothetical protein
LNPDNHHGTETVDLSNGDRLVIRNHGCEYYVLTFRFETSRFDGDSTDTIYWLGKARLMMKDIAQGINSPLDIGAGVGAISTFLASFDTPAYYLGQEIVVKDDEIRDFLTLDRIQKINNSRFAFEISYARGPL